MSTECFPKMEAGDKWITGVCAQPKCIPKAPRGSVRTRKVPEGLRPSKAGTIAPHHSLSLLDSSCRQVSASSSAYIPPHNQAPKKLMTMNPKRRQ